MADPQAAVATQLRNIEAKTGKTLSQLYKLVAQSGLTKVSEQRAMLMETLGLGYGDANALALRANQTTAATPVATDPLDAIYVGAKAPLRSLHQRVIAEIDQFGDYEQAPKKVYISLRRAKQFAMLGPATKGQVELGLNVRDLPASPRLKALPPGGMCQYTVRLALPGEVDAELVSWLRAAYDAAA